jgi:secondary thiamine-phosphate synthase enzyme
MKTYFDFIEFSTGGCDDMLDITPEIRKCTKESDLQNGQVLIFNPGSTGALSTVEYEPGLKKDLPAFFEKIIPRKQIYHHNETWGDGNGHSHVRATLIGPSLTIPLVGGELVLGTWQQIVFLEFDNKSRNRKIAIQIIGE